MSRAAVHDALAAADAVPFHAQAPLATVTANVTNTGNVASGYVVMLFVVSARCACCFAFVRGYVWLAAQMGKNPVPLGPDPIQSLVGFDRVLLEPGQWTLVTFPLDATALSRVTEDGKRVSVPGTWQLRTDGAELNLAVV